MVKEIKKIIKNYLENNPKSILLLVSHDPIEIKDLCNCYYLIENQTIKKIKDIDSFFQE